MLRHPRIRQLAALAFASLLGACDSNPVVCDDYGRCGRMGSPPKSSSAPMSAPVSPGLPTLPAPQFNSGAGSGDRFTWDAWVGPVQASVCWTLDGSDPVQSGPCAYSSASTGNDRGGWDYVARVTVPRRYTTLRARSFAPGYLPSAIVHAPALP